MMLNKVAAGISKAEDSQLMAVDRLLHKHRRAATTRFLILLILMTCLWMVIRPSSRF